MGKSFHCPKCKSKDIHCMITNETTVSSTGGGYGAGKGCLGFLLFGPLGLLCGACGSKQKVTTENNKSTVWACKSCGAKFRDIEEIDSQISKESFGNSILFLIPGGVIALCLWFVFRLLFASTSSVLEIFLFLIIWAVCSIPAYFISKKQQEKKLSELYKERNYIKENAYRDE